MIWSVLVGNTRTVAGLMDGTRVRAKVIVPTPKLKSTKGASTFARKLRAKSRVEGVGVASVVPPVDSFLRKSFLDFFGVKAFFIASRSTPFITLGVKRPAQTGADRIANAVAAREIYGCPVLVVDFGTGTTVDAVNRKGAYVGGAILPGLGISLRALHDYTAKIPAVSFGRVRAAVGKTTQEAVRSGVYYGALGAARELVGLTRKEIGRGAPAIGTGGWSFAFKKSGLFRTIDPDLTLRGISILWRRAHEKH